MQKLAIRFLLKAAAALFALGAATHLGSKAKEDGEEFNKQRKENGKK